MNIIKNRKYYLDLFLSWCFLLSLFCFAHDGQNHCSLSGGSCDIPTHGLKIDFLILTKHTREKFLTNDTSHHIHHNQSLDSHHQVYYSLDKSKPDCPEHQL